MCNSCTKICQEISQTCTREELKLLNTYASEVNITCGLCEHGVVSPAWPFPKVTPTLPAYILHTSGTVGEPKPITVPHCCIVPNVMDLRERFGMNRNRDVVFNAAPLTFDPSVVEVGALHGFIFLEGREKEDSFSPIPYMASESEGSSFPRYFWPYRVVPPCWLSPRRSKGHLPSLLLYCSTGSMPQSCRQRRHWCVASERGTSDVACLVPIPS